MKRIKFPVLMVLFLIIILLFTAFGPEKWVNVSEKIDGNNTGEIGGTYYSLEEAFAKINSVEKAILANQMAVSASADYTNLLNEEAAEDAFAQTDIPAYTTEGKLMEEPYHSKKVKPNAIDIPKKIQIVAEGEAGDKSDVKLKATINLQAKNKYSQKNCRFFCKKTIISRK